MAILINEKSRVLVQGITGTEGQKATALMKEYGTQVVAGVTPGKGGQTAEGVPVYDSVREAMRHHPDINVSAVYVPPFAARDAVVEAVANGIPLINCITEGIAIHDAAYMNAYAKMHGACIVGPSSIGIISPEKSRVGVVGGPQDLVQKIYKQGSVGVISKSGGMTNETAWVVRQAGLGQSTVIGMGGDIIIGSSFVDLLELFEHDKETKGVVMFGELGGTYEDQVADMLTQKKFTKPLAVFIGGIFAEKMPQGMKFGHAGALIEGNRGLPKNKIAKLKAAGALIAERHDQLGEIIKKAL
ncbi:MAG: succinate--CoA ligase subunit alpha [Candidatus Aenigmarchaeota archaeon]|nr:succinate--CoA ligase subunit alpha [Candidatus Aenigmarchaeota archaeon]